MAFSIQVEDPRQPEMDVLIAELNAFLSAKSPPENCFQMTVDQMVSDDVIVYIARDDAGAAVGCGALRLLPDEWAAGPEGPLAERWGEVKRMYSKPKARGQGLGSAILTSIESEARKRGLHRLVLETGLEPTHPGAHATYKKAGFGYRDRFGDYPASEWNVFMEKVLA